MAIYDFFRSIILRSVAVEHCDHRAPGGTISNIPSCTWRQKCFIVLFGPWRYNGYKHVTPLGSFLYYTFRNKLLQRNTAPERCVHRVKNLSGRRREASRLYIYLFSGHSVSFSSNTFCAVPSKIPLPN